MLYTILPVSLVLAAVCALLNLWLGARVGKVRRASGIQIGDGGSEPLVRRMRAQANFLESAPFVVVLTALIEAATGQHGWLWALAGLFVASRLVHPLGMDRDTLARQIGAGVTALVLLVLAGWAIAIPIVTETHIGRGEPAETVLPPG